MGTRMRSIFMRSTCGGGTRKATKDGLRVVSGQG
jgi:hypothetical protein